jgi:RecA-family ATPase
MRQLLILSGAEDEADELHRRLADITAHYGVRFTDLIAGGLQLLSFASKDAVLGVAGKDGVVKPTPLFEQLHKAALQKQPKLITLDTVSDVFVGNETALTSASSSLCFAVSLSTATPPCSC